MLDTAKAIIKRKGNWLQAKIKAYKLLKTLSDCDEKFEYREKLKQEQISFKTITSSSSSNPETTNSLTYSLLLQSIFKSPIITYDLFPKFIDMISVGGGNKNLIHNLTFNFINEEVLNTKKKHSKLADRKTSQINTDDMILWSLRSATNAGVRFEDQKGIDLAKLALKKLSEDPCSKKDLLDIFRRGGMCKNSKEFKKVKEDSKRCCRSTNNSMSINLTYVVSPCLKLKKPANSLCPSNS
ncbi:MAG: hypothetical protein N4A43_00420 [Alphaproteobacteria bacterium]|jgi:hypothetical protein|nr:hypothetical protein [Alphaproteobacteria bacterium]